MPGHIGTSIAINTGKVLGKPDPQDMTADDLAPIRERMMRTDNPLRHLDDDQLKTAIKQRQIDFRDNAPLSAAGAADIILEGVRTETWRILVGDDAQRLDQMVRTAPEDAYEPSFLAKLREG